MSEEAQPIILDSARRHFDDEGWTDEDSYRTFEAPIARFAEGEDRYMVLGFDSKGRAVELGVERAYDVDRMVAYHFFKARQHYLKQL